MGPYQLLDLNTYAKSKTFVDPRLERAVHVPEDQLQHVCKELAQLCVPKEPHASNGWKNIADFALALVVNSLTPRTILEDAGSWQLDEVNIWLLRLNGMPGPTFGSVPTNTTSYYHWYHGCGLETVFGALSAGPILPSCADGLQLPTSIPLPGFFARARREDGQISEEQLLQDCKDMYFHRKTAHGIHFSGAALGNHVKISRASMWLEQLVSFRACIVKSKSTDKRWCTRPDYGKIQFACPTRKQEL